MQEQKGDIFTIASSKQAICITTNGMIKTNGNAVMGAGIAKVATQKFPAIETKLGKKLKQYGNHVYLLGEYMLPNKKDESVFVFSFPTKNHWKEQSNIALIKQSCIELKAIITALNINTCYIPQPGCGCGQLKWNTDVKPVIEKLLDDRFIITTL